MSDEYIVVDTLLYLALPFSSPLTGGYLYEELFDPYAPYKLASWHMHADEHPRYYLEAYAKMCQQFIPRVDSKIAIEDIVTRLKEHLDVWTYLYALCLISLQHNHLEEAEEYLVLFRELVGEGSSEGRDAQAEIQLLHFYDLAKTNLAQLGAEVDNIRDKNLADLTAKKTTVERIARLVLT
jgi:hypothetical protein